MGFSAAASSRQIRRTFGNNSVSRGTAKHWFQNCSSGNLSPYDELRSSRQLILDDEDLKTVIENDNRQTCGELALRFQVSEEAIRFQLQHTGKTYKLSKCVGG